MSIIKTWWNIINQCFTYKLPVLWCNEKIVVNSAYILLCAANRSLQTYFSAAAKKPEIFFHEQLRRI